MDVKINKFNKNLTDDELKGLSKEELIDHVKRLNAHNLQLKNIIEKKINAKSSKRSTKHHRKFDFSKWHKRHILLKFCYLGWDMQGYVVQEDTIETVEHKLFEGLRKVCLVDDNLENYHRCGRTDKGVSAFEQVISITLRSKIPPDQQLSTEGVKDEINYCGLLNKVLPKNMRCISWMPLSSNLFSARFDCTKREYKYFFPRGDLNIDAMQQACIYLEGSHDFRNLCKMDVGNGVVNFTRNLESVQIKLQAKNFDNKSGYDMFYLHIQGNAFLWHQIRCIVSVLLLIGEDKEQPEIIRQLLDVTKNDRKPQYSLSSEIPLNLFFTHFREDDGTSEVANKWHYDRETLMEVIRDLQSEWCVENTKVTMIYEMTKSLENDLTQHFPDESEIKSQPNVINKDTMRKQYKKLLERQKCSRLEERIEHYVKRQRISVGNNSVCSSTSTDGQ